MKFFIRLILITVLLIDVSVSFSFVGGGHGGSSGGGGYHRSYSHHSYSSHSSESAQGGLVNFFILIILILFFIGLFKLSEILGFDKYLKEYRQRKYLEKCRHTKDNPKRVYSIDKIERAIKSLNQKAMSDIVEVDNPKIKQPDKLNAYVEKAFMQLQKAWSDQDRTKLLRYCSNESYSSKLCAQLSTMQRMGVYNLIDETLIKECHLVKCYKQRFMKQEVLRFIVKGAQIDEYTTEIFTNTPDTFSVRKFNCIVDVVPFPRSFKIFQVIIDEHVDDYIVREFKKYNKGKFSLNFAR